MSEKNGLLVLSLIIISLWLLVPIQADDHQRKVYIVYMGDNPTPDIPAVDVYLSMIKEALGGDVSNLVKAAEYLMYTYKNFKGYVAHLTDKEAEIMSSMAGVVSVFPSIKFYPRTTRSWDFMGFPLGVERSDVESDIIIGVIDTGIWPESESFNDEGLSPPPAKWKGRCETALNFTCNNKIIGAQYFRADGNITKTDIASPRDSNGHGTHTASTAAGVIVDDVSFLGLGEGTARGGVPSARIAVYKVCWIDGCDSADVLAAFDAAISDGVDIISASLGFDAQPYLRDPIGIGAFQAMKKNILTSAAAGNSGPDLLTMENHAPWLLSVGASSTDRKFITEVKFGNGLVVQGISLNTFDPQKKTFPVILGRDASNKSSAVFLSRYCRPNSLNKTLVEGKIVICDRPGTGEVPFIAGAAGVIMRGAGSHDSPRAYPLPASYLNADNDTGFSSYLRSSTSTPVATILKSVAVNDTSAPTVVSFSSRGPNPISPGILKPDLVAPGVAILAAYSPIPSVSGIVGDSRFVSYKMVSGTSMACPHASGVAAYVKSFHPTWSPAAIKSALMTTANPMSSALHEEAELAYGAGHINPLKALNPGLVYDANEDDYVNFLCNEGLNATAISLISGKNIICNSISGDADTHSVLNYPSLTIRTSVLAFDVVLLRTVTNVGSPNSTYRATVTASVGKDVTIKVDPSVLEFKTSGEKLSFSVQVSGSTNSLISASLVWDDGEHQVRSPIVVYNL